MQKSVRSPYPTIYDFIFVVVFFVCSGSHSYSYLYGLLAKRKEARKQVSKASIISAGKLREVLPGVDE